MATRAISPSPGLMAAIGQPPSPTSRTRRNGSSGRSRMRLTRAPRRHEALTPTTAICCPQRETGSRQATPTTARAIQRQSTFPRFLTHTYSSYKRGIPQTELQPEGVNLSRIVNDAGNVVSDTNGELRTTGYGYDGLNRVSSIAYPTGNSVTISFGTASKTATRGSLVENTSYDGFGRPLSVTLGGITRTYSWDALGRMTFASNPGSSQGTTYQYDILNRLRRATNADQTFRTVSYGAATMTATDERNRPTTNTYRAYGDPARTFLMNVKHRRHRPASRFNATHRAISSPALLKAESVVTSTTTATTT